MQTTSVEPIREHVRGVPEDIGPMVKFFENLVYPDGYGPSNDYSPLYMDIATNHLKNGGVVYDLGCGDGGQFRWMHNLGNADKIIGVDASKMLIRRAKQGIDDLIMGDKVYALQADCRNTPLKSDSADYVLLIDVLHCLNRDSGGRVLDECVRVCKPGGKIIISAAAKDYYLARLGGGYPAHYTQDEIEMGILVHPNRELFGTVYSRNEIEEEFLARGCEVEIYEMNCRDFFGPKVPPEYTKKIWDTPTSLIAVASKLG